MDAETSLTLTRKGYFLQTRKYTVSQRMQSPTRVSECFAITVLQSPEQARTAVSRWPWAEEAHCSPGGGAPAGPALQGGGWF